MNYFAGIDVSKSTLDVTLIGGEKVSVYSKFTNNNKGHKQLLVWVKAHGTLTQTLFCMEHTGLYSRVLLLFLQGQGCQARAVMPIHIKRSMGLQRGKNDKADSLRIARYAQGQLTAAAPAAAADLSVLKDWLACRERLVSQRQQLQVPVNEFAAMGMAAQAKAMQKAIQPALYGINKSIKQTEQTIRALIKKEADFKQVYELMLSVPGVGAITAWYLLAYTGGMQNFDNARQLACYCGVAPFEHSSGSSIRGRSRVSPMANRQLKSLLHLGALSIVKGRRGELFDYYERKVSQGKNKMAVINALRNKMLARVVSVVKNRQPYQPLNIAA